MTTDQHLDTGAMALGALPTDEAEALRGHLDDCPTCSAELVGFLQTAALLGSAVANTPPASLRRSLLEAISITPQLPPLPVPRADADAAPGRAGAFGVGGSADRAAGPVGADSPARARAAQAWYRRPQMLLAAAVAAIALAAGITFVAVRSSSTSTQASCVQSANDRTSVAPKVGSGGAVYAASCAEATVSPAGLPAPPAGRVYQLWVLRGTSARSVGVLSVSPGGSIDPKTAAVQPGDTAAAISIENAPGPAATPSKDIVWQAPLPTS